MPQRRPQPRPPTRMRSRSRARFAGGASLPGQPGTNFSVRLVRESLATSKRLALRQPAGTMVQQGSDFFVMGGPGNDPLDDHRGEPDRLERSGR